MDLLEEAERLFANLAGADECSDGSVASEDIERWQMLFNLSFSDARDNIERYRADFSQSRISDDH